MWTLRSQKAMANLKLYGNLCSLQLMAEALRLDSVAQLQGDNEESAKEPTWMRLPPGTNLTEKWSMLGKVVLGAKVWERLWASSQLMVLSVNSSVWG